MNTTKKHLLLEFEPVDCDRYGLNKDSDFIYFFKNNYFKENIYIMGISDLLAWYEKYHREVYFLRDSHYNSIKGVEREFILELKLGCSIRVRILHTKFYLN